MTRHRHGVKHSIEYLLHLESDAWALKRMAVLGRAQGRCERCGAAPAQDVHHLTYERLGDEPLSDLQALCRRCHKKADEERERQTAQRRYNARLDGWMRARYGDAWEENGIEVDGYDIERFEAAIERDEEW